LHTPIIAAAAALLWLSACTTVEEISQSEPVRAGEMDGDYRTLSACLAAQYLPTTTNLIPDEPNHTTKVITFIEGLGATATTLRESAPRRSVVEIRTGGGNPLISSDRMVADVWAKVRRCSLQAPAPETSPPSETPRRGTRPRAT
jgi:hypothetical protein